MDIVKLKTIIVKAWSYADVNLCRIIVRALVDEPVAGPRFQADDKILFGPGLIFSFPPSSYKLLWNVTESTGPKPEPFYLK